jgi:hypothetical protein
MTIEREVLRYAREHAGEAFDEIPTEVRLRVREIIGDHFEMDLRERKRNSRSLLESNLFDEFAALNLDWRLVVQTELGECQLQGFIACQPSGAIVRRMEAYKGACPDCLELNGRTFTVVMPDALDKNWTTQVWVGKSRVHSVSAESALFGGWPSAGLQHPGCRGTWTLVHIKPPEVSQEFADWLEAALAKVRPRQVLTAVRATRDPVIVGSYSRGNVQTLPATSLLGQSLVARKIPMLWLSRGAP